MQQREDDLQTARAPAKPARRGWRAAVLALIIVWLASGFGALQLLTNDLWFSIGHGSLRVKWIDDRNWPEMTWEDIEKNLSRSALLVNNNWHLYTDWPGLLREFASPIGTWWTFSIPIWFVAVLIVLYQIWRRICTSLGDPLTRAQRNVRSSAIGCSICVFAFAVGSLVEVVVPISSDSYTSFGSGTISWETIPDVWMAHDWLGESRPVAVSMIPFMPVRWRAPHWAVCAQSTIGYWEEVHLPLWLPAVAGALWFIVARRRLRCLRLSGHCTKCCYNLTGNVSGRCPECGTLISNAHLL